MKYRNKPVSDEFALRIVQQVDDLLEYRSEFWTPGCISWMKLARRLATHILNQ